MSKRNALPTNPLEERVIENVASGGWFVALIPPEGGAPPWGFTVGLYENFKQPEIILIGLPPQVTHAILNGAGEMAMTEQLVAGFRTDQLLQNLSCELRAVDKFWYPALVGVAGWYYEGDDFPMLQCLWPDREGKLPFEDSFDPKLLAIQPDLATTDPAGSRMGPIIRAMQAQQG